MNESKKSEPSTTMNYLVPNIPEDMTLDEFNNWHDGLTEKERISVDNFLDAHQKRVGG